MDLRFHEYPSREALAEGLAAGVAAILATAIHARGAATLAVSGGSTPKLFLQKLSAAQIEWDRVTVLLVDERWVASDSERSNARLVADNLLQGAAAKARFEAFFVPGESAFEAAAGLNRRFEALTRPLDAAVLGMGNDGHTASFFPQSEQLGHALAPTGGECIAAVEAPGAGEPRITLTLPVLLSAHFLALHIEGDDKRDTLREALAEGPVEDMPVRAVLRQDQRDDLQIFWAR
ncbi:6-phosphogluconolactonase [Aureimonas frigidaquae]|uniref:6-phosphogluconolactonase n=1 Tax=Aureimonas frigidaquae TaxID=424757 RepID=A0A0N7KXV5_9HYPH|nr:6-phosphogluconolactonase [Aureimonas frigidaquae]BAT27977.1 6-phosphogluconolactonase [Aureimonas frigidaquae]